MGGGAVTIDDWRARYDGLNAEIDRLRAEVERLREDAERARWCEENRADVCYTENTCGEPQWFVQWDGGKGTVHSVRRPDRNAAIDAARGKA